MTIKTLNSKYLFR